MNTLDIVRQTAEQELNSKVTVIPFGNMTINQVFRIVTENDERYIFKIYSNSDWPEKGKLLFIDRKLTELGVPHANIVKYGSAEAFPNGYNIERCMTGTTCDKADLSDRELADIFSKLGAFAGRVHAVKFDKFGYIGNGSPDYASFEEFIGEFFEDISANLVRQKLYDAKSLAAAEEKILNGVKSVRGLSAVLCHGDLSDKNIMLDKAGEICLIDYDDAHALPWVCDAARLVFWMRMNYSRADADRYRTAFLHAYNGDIQLYETAEDALLAWYGVDMMSFSAGTPAFVPAERIFKEALSNLEI